MAEQMTPHLSRRHVAILSLTLAYLIVSSAGAGVAIGRDLTAEWMGLLKSDNELWVEFLIGGGTALSATVWMLALMAAAAAVSLRADRAGTVATLLLSVMSALVVIGALGEPITWRSIAPETFDPLILSICMLLIAIPAVLAILAFLEFRARRAHGAGARAL